MDGGCVDDDGRARLPSRASRATATRSSSRGVGRDAEVGAAGGRGVAEVVEEPPRHGDGLVRRVEHDRREVEQYAVENGREVGVGPGVQPQRGGAAVEVGERLGVQLLRVVAAQLDADVAPAGRRGASAAGPASSVSVGRTERAERRCRRGWCASSFAHTASSGSSSRSRPALRSTAAAAFSQSARVAAGPSSASASVPWSGSSSAGSARPPSTAPARSCLAL